MECELRLALRTVLVVHATEAEECLERGAFEQRPEIMLDSLISIWFGWLI